MIDIQASEGTRVLPSICVAQEDLIQNYKGRIVLIFVRWALSDEFPCSENGRSKDDPQTKAQHRIETRTASLIQL